jgi:hypothetical protein
MLTDGQNSQGWPVQVGSSRTIYTLSVLSIASLDCIKINFIAHNDHALRLRPTIAVSCYRYAVPVQERCNISDYIFVSCSFFSQLRTEENVLASKRSNVQA